MNKRGALGFFIILIIIVLGLVVLFNPNITGKFGFEKKDKCRIDSCPALVNGICDMKTEKGSVMKNLNDILHDCNLIDQSRTITFRDVKGFCERLGEEEIISCESVFEEPCEEDASCNTNADCGVRGECRRTAGQSIEDPGSCVCPRITGYCDWQNDGCNDIDPAGCRQANLGERECCESGNHLWCEG